MQEETPRRKRRWPRITIVAGIVLVLLAAAGLFGVAWWASDQAVKPNHDPANHPTYPDTVLDVRDTGSGKTVVLSASSPMTHRRGTYWLAWREGSARIGDITAQAPDSVERPLLDGPVPPKGTPVAVTMVVPSDPKIGIGLDFTEVSVPTELGPAPAWFVPATGPAESTWVIAVHGQNGRRNALTPVLPTYHRLGLPVLAITYRNDDGAPASEDGLMHLGESEWRDLESAVRYAQGQGARRIFLHAASNGGQIAGQFLARSPLAGMVTSVLMDAPTSSMRRVGEHSAEQYGAPGFATWLTGQVIKWRTGMDLEQLDLLNHPPAVKPPTLLLQGDADTQVPVQLSRDFFASAQRVGWPMEYHEFPGAEHVETWNSDPLRYEKLLADFVTRTVLTSPPGQRN
ncbi:alpha/beta hydrolase family protein [Amycolatopsis anabasis]|uniref:alpha/beta hydrolase family protein n=1 Tax=Amycolatopsis anabasis TaxID=1840409 RepID=UPI00131E4365|nr:prolyl oligopeptidase family serine peptidase [Amycolatopsis anabasis]